MCLYILGCNDACTCIHVAILSFRFVFTWPSLSICSLSHTHTHTHTHAAIVIEMENLGILDFKNKIQDGNVIDLSHTTITFCRLIMGFVSDTMKFYTPELLLNFVDCFCDIFKHMVNLYVDAFCRVENVPVGDFIVADAQFIIETLLPTVGSSINIQTCVQIPDFVRLHDR